MESVLQYSLTPLPLSLVHIDGIMIKTGKSQLLRHMEKIIKSEECPEERNYDVVDGMFILRTLPTKLPETYGELSSYILRNLCSSKSSRIDVIFDRYKSPSIKDSERITRSSAAEYKQDFCIQGPHQKRPKDFHQTLNNPNFKVALIEFLAKDWHRYNHKDVLKGKYLFFTHENKCFVNNNGVSQEIKELECDHEEADSRLYFHCEGIFVQDYSLRDSGDAHKRNIVVRTGDTDVLIIFLSNMAKSRTISASHKIWFDFGV